MFFDLMSKGGPLMWLILLNALLALGVFLERWLHFHRAQINATDFVTGIRNLLQRGSLIEAIALCDETPGPIPQVVKAAIVSHDHGREQMRETIQDVARHEVARLERRLTVLATIAQVTPLIGFLGTVLGMIDMFRVIQEAQLPSPGQLAGGVWQALLTTAGGLVVAVPAYVAFNYLVARVNNLVLDMERASNEIVGYFANGTVTAETKSETAVAVQ